MLDSWILDSTISNFIHKKQEVQSDNVVIEDEEWGAKRLDFRIKHKSQIQKREPSKKSSFKRLKVSDDSVIEELR